MNEAIKPKPKSKEDLLQQIESERRSLDDLIAGLSEAQKLDPSFEGGRSIKDLLVHIVDWEQRMIQWSGETVAGEIPVRPGPGLTWDDLDKVNEETFQENKDRPLAWVEAEAADSYAQSLKHVQEISEEDLMDGERFPWRKGDPLWQMVTSNTNWHYKEHREQLEEWLKG